MFRRRRSRPIWIAGNFRFASSSPELFLRISGAGRFKRGPSRARARVGGPTRDAQLTYELQTSPKDMAELVMITDLMRNDLGKVCEYGSVQVPELARLERYPASATSGFHRHRAIARRSRRISRPSPPVFPAAASRARPKFAPWKSLTNWSR